MAMSRQVLLRFRKLLSVQGADVPETSVLVSMCREGILTTSAILAAKRIWTLKARRGCRG